MRIEIDNLNNDSDVVLNGRHKNVYKKYQMIRINNFGKHLHKDLVMYTYACVFKLEFRKKVTPHVFSTVK